MLLMLKQIAGAASKLSTQKGDIQQKASRHLLDFCLAPGQPSRSAELLTLVHCNLVSIVVRITWSCSPKPHMDSKIAADWKQISEHRLGATEAAIMAAQVAGGNGAHPTSAQCNCFRRQSLSLTSVPAAKLPVDVTSVTEALCHSGQGDALVQEQLSQLFSSAFTLSASLAAPDGSAQGTVTAFTLGEAL